jgi:hypothetical protein
LKGPNVEHSPFGIYLYYPLVIIVRLAYIFFALFKFYVTTGTIPYFDYGIAFITTISLDIATWLSYLTGFIALFTLRLLSSSLSRALDPFALLWMDYDRGPGSRSARRRSSRCQSEVILIFDSRLMILSHYCCFQHWTRLLSSSALWYTSRLRASTILEHHLAQPSQRLMCHVLRWPPDGPCLHIVLFSFMILSQIYIIGLCIFGSLKITSSSVLQFVHTTWTNQSSWLNNPQLTVSSFMSLFHSTSKRVSQVFTTVYAFSSDNATLDNVINWDSDSVSVVVDNSANTHIWNNLEDFREGSLRYFDDNEDVGVLTIDENSSRPLGVGQVVVTIREDDGTMTDVVLHDCLYFPSSPVKIISVTALAKTLNDASGTWIKTCWQTSTFSWDGEKHCVRFAHPSSQLPVLQVNTGISTYESFYTLFDDAGATYQPLPLMTCQTCLPTDKYEDVCFATDEIQSAQGDPRYRFTSKDSLELPPSEETLPKVGDKLRLHHNGIHQLVDIVAVNVDSATTVHYFTVALNDGHCIKVTKEFLSPIEDDDIALIPITHAQVEEHIDRLDPETLEVLLNPPPNSELIKEFMGWHYRSGHLPINRMFDLCKRGYFPRRFLELENTKLVCPSCIFGKCKRRPWRTKGSHGSLRSEDEKFPGAKVSIDHVISAQPGLVPRMDGRHTRDRISGGCVFIDNDSRYSYTHLQTSIDGVQTLEAKQGFEHHANTNGVAIKSYHADNGIFAEKFFRDQVQADGQRISYCAVGAHHQNGIIERHIGTLTHGARTNLLHAQRRWPEAIGTILWPFAWKDFERRYNHFYLDQDGLSPLNRFTSTTVRSDIRTFHPFGCPVFVLAAGLQSAGSAIPKWDPRARVGIYLGHSPCHAGSVALVLNPKTLRVSPQYHIVFDDEFTTVPFMRNGEIPPHWSDLVKCSVELTTDEDFDLAMSWANSYINSKPVSIDEEGVSGGSILLNGHVPESQASTESTVSEEVNTEQSRSSEEGSNNTRESEEASSIDLDINLTALESPNEDVVTNQLLFPSMPDLNDLTCRRSKRTRKPSATARASNNSTVKRIFGLFVACTAVFTSSLVTTATAITTPIDSLHRAVLHSQRVNTHFDGTLNTIHHAVLNVVAGDNDTYTLRDMLKQDDKSSFISAMMKEVQDHESRNHWTVLPRSVIPSGTKTILAVWSFKRKRYPDGRILKHKARLCAHGGMQTWGVNYWETYAPVVNWMSIRTLMALSILHDLETRSIDFVLAFPQAPLDVDIYMEPPYGFDIDGKKDFILKLNKNLYGLKNASHNFWNLLREGLEARGYKQQSESDPCVFLGKESIILTYVDDIIVISKRGSTAADDLIKALREGHENFDFTDDGDLEKYLGVDVKRHKDGRIELTQTHLIQRLLEVIGMDPKTVNPRSTPAIKPLLFKDIDGLVRKYNWNYRQAVGMLNYLTGTSRPDLAMAVHQAARFCVDPKLSHERAVQRIGKYLIGTMDKGIIFKPDITKGIECFVDADFAGGWNQADAIDAGSVLSRTGYVIMYAGCPLTWCSKLQTEIALSTTEAEYIALSQSLREVIPLIQLLKEVNEIFPIHMPTPEIHCKVWEDNNGALSLAQKGQFSPRTKHIAIKYHHFREHVNKGIISIHAIDTKEQTADIFTKPLDESLFMHLRMKLCGW